MKSKPEIREEILTKLRAHGPGAKKAKDGKIQEKARALPEFRDARVVAFYVSFKREVDTAPLIEEAKASGKTVVVPVVKGGAMEFAPEGSPGPFQKEKIDLVIVPGVAFTRDGKRLGRGKGHYDRFLKDLPAGVKKVGLAYALQICEDLPTTPGDVPVDIVLTD